MALVYATKNGNWSDTTVWNTGSLPTAVDIVRPNNFTVTIDVNVTVTEIRNDAGGSAVAGGSFTLNDGVTVTASNGFYGTYQNTVGHALLVYAGTGTATVNGNLNGSQINVSLGSCLLISSTGTATVNGDLNAVPAGGSNPNCVRITADGTLILNGNLNQLSAGFGIRNSEGNGTVTITGNITANGGTAITNTSGTVTITGLNITSNTTATVITNSGNITINANIINNSPGAAGTFTMINNSGTISIIGDVSGPNSVNNSTYRTIANTGTVNITGNVNAGTATQVGSLSSSFTIFNNNILNITGTVNSTTNANLGTLTNCNAVRNQNGTVNIIGNCIGGIGGTIVSLLSGVFNEIGTINITGNAIGGSTGLAVVNNSTGTLTLNGNAIGGTSWFAIEGVNAAGNTIIERAVYTAQGQSPITGYIKFKTTNPEIDVLREDSVIVTLRDPLNVSGLLPNTSDVRSGTTYNSGSSTGTLAMPANNLVQLGVPVDNTVGTANLTPQDFWNYLISNGFTGGSIGERLKNASTVDTTGAQIAAFSN